MANAETFVMRLYQTSLLRTIIIALCLRASPFTQCVRTRSGHGQYTVKRTTVQNSQSEAKALVLVVASSLAAAAARVFL